MLGQMENRQTDKGLYSEQNTRFEGTDETQTPTGHQFVEFGRPGVLVKCGLLDGADIIQNNDWISNAWEAFWSPNKEQESLLLLEVEVTSSKMSEGNSSGACSWLGLQNASYTADNKKRIIILEPVTMGEP